MDTQRAALTLKLISHGMDLFALQGCFTFAKGVVQKPVLDKIENCCGIYQQFTK